MILQNHMSKKIFNLALKKSATLFFVAVFVLSTGFNLSMPFTARAQENTPTEEVVTKVETTDVQSEVVEDINTEKTEEVTEEPTEPEVLGVVNEEGVQGGNGGGNSGAVWTTTGSCGEPQNINHYEVGETVYINGSGFDADTEYDWVIKEPGNNGDILADGSESTDSEGDVCFSALLLLESHVGGPYNAKYNDKNDNFSVVSGDDEECEVDCEEDETATVIATKIVCPTEDLLPNRGDNGANITNLTATNFLITHPTCYLEEGWKFEWSLDGIGNPGDNVGAGGADWNEFDSTTDEFGVAIAEVPAGAKLWFREQMKDGYVPFSGDTTNDPYDTISAEFYCHNDVLHYDNWEWIDAIEEGNTYNCIAFNALEDEPEDPTENTCVDPSALGDDSEVVFGISPELTLQQILDAEYGGGAIDAVNDETKIQVWDVPVGTDSVTFTARFIKKIAGHTNTFGYYVNGDLGTFVDVAYDAPVVVDTTSVTSIGFAEKSVNGGTNKFATEKSLNDGGSDYAVVYNNADNTFVLAFEDVKPINNSDKDYNDLVVEVTINRCTEGGEQCVEGPTWADEVIISDSDQGTRKDGSDVLANRSVLNSVLGEDDGNGGAGTGFFSLGKEGTITVKFDKYVENVVSGNGFDLSFHEITNGRDSYPEENAKVEVSQDSITWKDIGEVSSKATDGIDYLDFDSTGWSWIQYVRITDTTDFSLHSNDADGYDIDAIDATNGLCDEPTDGNVCEVGVELIKNGGFENPEMTNGNGWDIFPSGTATLSWIAEWLNPDFDAPVIANIEIQENGLLGWTTPYGDQWVELDSDYGFNTNESSATRISQDIPTEIGKTYEIKYLFGARPNVVDNTIDVKVNGNSVDTQSADGTGDLNIAWNNFTKTFVADSNTSTISFENTDTSNTLGTFIDEVSVKCTEDDTNGGGGDPSCGDGEVNQESEECDAGQDGDENCSASCEIIDGLGDGDTGGGGSGGGGGGSSGGGGGSSGSSSTSTSEVLDDGLGGGGEVLGATLAATGTENVSYLMLSGLILAFLALTKRRKAII